MAALSENFGLDDGDRSWDVSMFLMESWRVDDEEEPWRKDGGCV